MFLNKKPKCWTLKKLVPSTTLLEEKFSLQPKSNIIRVSIQTRVLKIYINSLLPRRAANPLRRSFLFFLFRCVHENFPIFTAKQSD